MVHLANHKASASHNGATASSAFRIPRANALTSEHAISRSRSSQARLCAKYSKSSTSPVSGADFRDVVFAFTGIDDSFYFLPQPLPSNQGDSRRSKAAKCPLPPLFLKRIPS
jgi:hypothetical protein